MNHESCLYCIPLITIYVRDAYPDDFAEEMTTIVTFICQVYAPSWFRIKMDPVLNRKYRADHRGHKYRLVQEQTAHKLSGG